MAQLTALTGTHLSVDDAASYLGEVRPSARLRRAEAGQTPTALLGGEPELPSAMQWPSWEAMQLDFRAAVDLPAVHAVLPGAPLPSTGRLLFFAVGSLFGPGDEMVGALQPVSRPGWRVIYVPEGTETVERRSSRQQRQSASNPPEAYCVRVTRPPVNE